MKNSGQRYLTYRFRFSTEHIPISSISANFNMCCFEPITVPKKNALKIKINKGI